MANTQGQKPNLERYIVIHVATTCDEHGVFVTKDSAEVIELGWILLDAKGAEEVSDAVLQDSIPQFTLIGLYSFIARAYLSNPRILPSHHSAVSPRNLQLRITGH